MGHMKEAVIYDYETFYANPVSCVDLCSQHKPLPEPILIITNYFILDDKDSGQAEEHCIQMVSCLYSTGKDSPLKMSEISAGADGGPCSRVCAC
jgi:hypothetical protein